MADITPWAPEPAVSLDTVWRGQFGMMEPEPLAQIVVVAVPSAPHRVERGSRLWYVGMTDEEIESFR